MREFIARRGSAIIASVALVAACGLGAAAYLHYRLPNPAACDDAGIVRWIATQDLADESEALQRELLNRVIARLEQGIEFQSFDGGKTSRYQSTIDRNVELLLERFLDRRYREFSALASEEQVVWAEGQAAWLDRTRLIECVTLLAGTRPDAGAAATSHASTRLTRILNEWAGEDGDEQRLQRQGMIGTIQAAWLKRRMAKLWPTP